MYLYLCFLFVFLFSSEQDHPLWAKYLYLYFYFLGTRPPFISKLFVFVFILFNYICILLGAHGQIFCICICIFLGARPPAMGKGSDCLIGALPPHDEQPRRLNSDLFSFFFHRRKGGIQHGGTHTPATKIKLGNTAIGSCGRPIEERDRERHRPQIMKALRLNLVESHSALLWEKQLQLYLDPQEGGVCPSLSYSSGF